MLSSKCRKKIKIVEDRQKVLHSFKTHTDKLVTNGTSWEKLSYYHQLYVITKEQFEERYKKIKTENDIDYVARFCYRYTDPRKYAFGYVYLIKETINNKKMHYMIRKQTGHYSNYSGY
jgi:hypothetical protein